MGQLTISSDSQNNIVNIGSIDSDLEVYICVDGTYWLNKSEAESIINHLKEQFKL